MCWRSFWVGLAIMSFASAAEASTTASLDYRAEPDCPDAARFMSEVSARLGRVPFEASAANVVRVRIRSDESEWVATLELADGTSQVHRATSCAESASRAADALAEWLRGDPAAPALAPPTSPNPAPVPSPPPRRAPTPSPTAGFVLPMAAPASPTVPVRVRFESPNDEGFLHLRIGTAVAYVRGARSPIAEGHSFAPVCQMPCETFLPPGTHTFGVSSDVGDAPEPARGALNLAVPSELVVHHRARLGFRVTGWVLLLGGMVAALAGFPGVVQGRRPGLGAMIGGGVVTVIGLPMTLLRDRYSVTSAPL